MRNPAVVFLAMACIHCARGGFSVVDDRGYSDQDKTLAPDLPADLVTDSAEGSDAKLDSITDSIVDPSAPFGSPTHVAELGSKLEEDDPSLTADMLEIFFDREGDIWHATRSSVFEVWSNIEIVEGINSSDVDTSPEVSGDGLTLFFTSTRAVAGVQGSYDIYFAVRNKRGDSWDSPEVAAGLNSSSEDFSGGTTEDLLTIIFPSKRAVGRSDDDLYQARRASSASAWSTPQLLPELNSADHDASPWLSADGLVICFDRGPAGSSSPRAILFARRLQPEAPFSEPEPVEGIESSYRDSDPWLSPDLSTIYFASNRSGNREIYVAKR